MIAEEAHATQRFGEKLAHDLKPSAIVALYGDLGVGKTTLVKGIISALTGESPDAIQSPTFTLMNCYQAAQPIYHFDLYRLVNADAFIEKGFIDYLDGEGICLIEWPERIESLLPKTTLRITLSHAEGNRRKIDV
jgi:tRNA threonylcarbamoyladenosine biosynthesis protein TsaE